MTISMVRTMILVLLSRSRLCRRRKNSSPSPSRHQSWYMPCAHYASARTTSTCARARALALVPPCTPGTNHVPCHCTLSARIRAGLGFRAQRCAETSLIVTANRALCIASCAQLIRRIPLSARGLPGKELEYHGHGFLGEDSTLRYDHVLQALVQPPPNATTVALSCLHAVS